MDEENQNTEEKQLGLIPALKQTWESAKSPIAFLAIGFLAGYFMSGKAPKAKEL